MHDEDTTLLGCLEEGCEERFLLLMGEMRVESPAAPIFKDRLLSALPVVSPDPLHGHGTHRNRRRDVRGRAPVLTKVEALYPLKLALRLCALLEILELCIGKTGKGRETGHGERERMPRAYMGSFRNGIGIKRAEHSQFLFIYPTFYVRRSAPRTGKYSLT